MSGGRRGSDDVVRRSVVRVDADGARRLEDDAIAREEPLEIRIAGEPLAITMRTPGEDHWLTVGFLFAEGVIRALADLGSVAPCGRPGDEGYGNTIDVVPAPGTHLDASAIEGARRGTLTTAACGVCGRRSIDDLLARIAPVGSLDAPPRISRAILASAPEVLASLQRTFAETGGVHAAAAIDREGHVLAHAEDVGRHNAVDKVVGRLLYDDALASAALLAVSGRVSFEIVQKAAAARIGAIAAISAPTSLAVELAERAGIVLAAFVRGGGLTLYAHAERVED